MPIYEYNCKDCNNDFEKIVRDKSQSIVCPKCGGSNIVKKYSVFGFCSKTESGSSKFVSSSGKSSCSVCSATSCASCNIKG